MNQIKPKPPRLLTAVVSIWALCWVITLIRNAYSVGLTESILMVVTFDEAIWSSMSVTSTLTVLAMTVVGLIAAPLISIKVLAGNLEAKSTFMLLNFVCIGAVVWGAFHISSFPFLAFALIPAGILIVMVSSEEIANYFPKKTTE